MSKIKDLIHKAISQADSVEYSSNTEKERHMCNVLDNITIILIEIEKEWDSNIHLPKGYHDVDGFYKD